MTKPCIIFDIDGTLADLRHRLEHVTGNRRDWETFFALIENDSPILPVFELLSSCSIANVEDSFSPEVICCSGRPERLRERTMAWLARHGAFPEALYMRPDGDTRADHVVKRELLVRLRADGWDPHLVIDDRPSVVDMWRSEGLVCLQSAPGEPELLPSALLTLMVGPTGAGKTTWLQGPDARELGIQPSQVLASDDFRRDLCGNFRDQTRNAEVFEALHRVARARLLSGLPTVLDATHLRRKDRLAAAALVPVSHPVRYVVLDRSMAEKVATADWRLEVLSLLERHAQTFQSQLQDILSGDKLPNVEVFDRRKL